MKKIYLSLWILFIGCTNEVLDSSLELQEENNSIPSKVSIDFNLIADYKNKNSITSIKDYVNYSENRAASSKEDDSYLISHTDFSRENLNNFIPSNHLNLTF